MSLDWSRCRVVPFAHQREDVEWLLTHPYALIASEMRTGKSKIVIDAAQFLYESGVINKVIIVAPAPVRSAVWFDEEVGQISKHLWMDTPAEVVEFHERLRLWKRGDDKSPLRWYVSNFEFCRSKTRLQQLLPACGPRTLLVLDESSFVKNHAAQQTKACVTLRKLCGRVVLLNGTPIFHSPLDLFSQGNLLHSRILDCKYITLFKARYAIQQPILHTGGQAIKKTVIKGRFRKEIILQEICGWTDAGIEDLQRRFAPYTVRRLQSECLDLPPKLNPVTLTCTLTPETWRAYKSMRDDLVVWLQNDKVATSATAAIKALRLSQITGGFLSGIEDANIEPDLVENIDLSATDQLMFAQSIEHPDPPNARLRAQASSSGIEIGREKLDLLLWFIEQQLEKDPNLHLVSWSRFRVEAFRAVKAVRTTFPQFQTAVLLGGQKKAEREQALSLLHPDTSPAGPCYVAGIEGTGSFGIDLCAAHTCVTLSSGYSPGRSAQTLDRVYGPNQKFPVAYYNIIATGPRGQKTIDHDILVTRETGENIATRTAAAWVKILTTEE